MASRLPSINEIGQHPLLPRPITSCVLPSIAWGGFIGQCRLGADEGDNNDDNHDDLIDNEDINNTSNPSAQHNTQPYKREEEDMAMKRKTTKQQSTNNWGEGYDGNG